jgi:hypothetical protein
MKKTLQRSTNKVSLETANFPDSCISYYSDGGAFSKTIFKYNATGLLTVSSDFVWNADQRHWQARHQVEYVYDSNGNVLSDIGIQFDESHGSFPHYQNNFTYTDKNDLSTQEYYTYDSGKNRLEGINRYEYFYNASGSPDSVIEYSKSDVLNRWIPSSKSIYGYTDGAIQNSCEIYKYDASAGKWTKYIKNIQLYNSAAQLQTEENYTASANNEWSKYSRTQNEYENEALVSSTAYNSDGVDWSVASKVSYGYSAGKMIQNTTKLYDPASSTWMNAFKDSIEYFGNGKIYKKTAFRWNKITARWVAVSKDIHNYDSGDALESYFYSSDGTWIGTQKSILKADPAGHNILDEKYGWDKETSAWIPSSKTEKVFDTETEKLSSSINYSLGSNSSWQGYLKQDYEYETLDDSSIGLKFVHNYDNNGSGWISSNSTEFFYSTKETSIDEQKAQHFVRVEWFPEQYISITSNIEMRHVDVYFINGTQKFTGISKVISTSGWQKGVYLVKVEAADGKRTVKKIDIH